MGRLIGLIFIAAGFGFAIEMLPAGFYDRGMALVGNPLVRAAETTTERVPASTGPMRDALQPALEAGQARQPRIFAADRPLVTNTTTPVGAPVGAHGVITSAAPVSARSTASTDPTELARLLQIELRRVGCYTGDIDGSWGAGSKRAMQSFTERANSTLPIDAPDLVLLSLVRNHGNATCSADCAAGQMMSSRGQCVKNPAEVQASTASGGWQPVVTVENRTVAAAPAQQREPVRQTTVRRVTVAPAPQLVAPRLVAGPTEAQRGEAQMSETPRNPASVATVRRDIDWGTRMSVGAGAPAMLPQPQLTSPITPAPVALTPPDPEVLRSTRNVRQVRPVIRSAPRQIQRPAYVDRPRPRSNWRRDAFVSRN